ncbi:MAG TPA: type VI secretion system tip protein VgrG [Chitinophagaceae bacterium]|jgi:Rhs element Vgr protein|nr:type VI secretion system tip protein VgrG [Chitinophagaceae bacterium]
MEEVSVLNTSAHDVVTFDILLDNQAVNPEYQVLSLSVSREINRIPSAKIVFRDGEASERTFAISNKDDFKPGKKIRINAGRDGTKEQVFQGIITKHAVRVKASGDSELIIECHDEAIRMTIGRHSHYYADVKDSEVFDELIGKYKGISGDTVATKQKHKELVQHHISDWDFMLLRSEANSMLVNVDDGTVIISRPDTSQQAVTRITYGDSVLEFEAEMDVRMQWKKIQAISWDFSNQRLFDADASSVSFSEHGNITGSDLADILSPDNYKLHHSGNLPEQELQDWVDGRMLRSRLAKIRGRAKFFGFAGIKPGNMVQLDGVGERFTGKAFVTAVRHDIGNGSWDTHIQFGLDPQPYSFLHDDLNDTEAAGLVGGIKGLQIGKVVQLENDPDGEHRILVRIPVIDDKARGTWMRMASLDAGSGRGAFFRPEIDDEVIVGFINNDPRNAVILGMLHSSAKGAPIDAHDVNHEKGFTTRSKMHISFNDDTRKIVIDTPAGNSITLDESGKKIEIIDQNQNKITMDTSGIKMDSPKNIEINAKGNMTLKATGAMNIGAATIAAKADGNISVEGAMAKLAGQGVTEITGGLVKIN